MTKRTNKFYRTVIILLGILEIIVAFVAYAVHYFTKTRMGMLRHVVYLNGKWEQTLQITLLKWSSAFILIVFIIIACVIYKKNKSNSADTKIVTILTVAISLWTMYYTLYHNTAMNRAYYILSICFIIITVLQSILNCCYYSMKKRIDST